MSVKYLLPCACGAKTPLEAGQAGQRVLCACGATLTAPTMRGLAQLEKLTAADPPPRRGRQWSRSQGILFSGGAIVAILGLVLAAYFGVVYSTAESRMAEIRGHYQHAMEDTRFDDLSPSELLEAWKMFQAVGLPETETAEWRELNRLSEHMVTAIGVALAVALAGILASASALFLRPKPVKAARLAKAGTAA